MLGLGTYLLGGPECKNTVLQALKIGYRMIDTATGYRNECEVGAAIIESKVPRSQIFVASKISTKEHGYQQSIEAVVNSLNRLKLEYLDLMLIHWPGVRGLKPDDIRNQDRRTESLRGLVQCKRLGLIKSVGVSNYLTKHIESIPLDLISHVSFNQIELHPLLWDSEMMDLVDLCKARNITVQAYASLGTGKLIDGTFPDNPIAEIAAEMGATKSQVLLQWAMSKGFWVIPKASITERLEENLAAKDIVLRKEHIAAIDAMCEKMGRHKFCWDPHAIA